MLKKVAAILIVLFLGIGFSLPLKQLYFGNDNWLSSDNLHQKNIDYLESEFESDEDLLLVIELEKSFFHPKTIETLGTLSDRLRTLPNLKEIKSPLDSMEIFREGDILHVESFQKAIKQKHLPNTAAYQTHFVKSDYMGRLLSKDFKTVALLLKLEENNKRNEFSARTLSIQKTKDIMKEFPLFKSYFFCGNIFLLYQMDSKTQKNLQLILPLLILFIAIVLWFLFHSFLKMLFVLIPTLLTLMGTGAVISLLGNPLTIINIILPILILVIAIADTVHIISRWEHLSIEEKKADQIITQTIRQTWLPCFITSVTTAIGFGSFYVSNLIPLKNFGLESFIVIILSFVLIVGVSWLLLYAFQDMLLKWDPFTQKKKKKMTLGSQHLYPLAKKYKTPIIVLSTILFFFFANALQHFRTETSFLDVFFKPKSAIQQNFKKVDQRLSGSGGLDILIKSNQKDGFKTASLFNQVLTLETKIEKIPTVYDVQSYINPIKMAHREFKTD
ncbi:hypothetical protein DID77_04775, partial [Candidatus Marinamargulisbacteria bacterium SCGC AG-439-L15]